MTGLTILNLGLGRDSLAMLCLVVERALVVDGAAIGPEQLDAVVFSDTGAEWDHTYALLPRVRELCQAHGIRLVVLAKPPADVWQANRREKGDREAPVWCRDVSGTIEERAARGYYHRRLPIIDEFRRFGKIAVTVSASCTDNHKVQPIRRLVDDLSVEKFGIGNRAWAAGVKAGRLEKHRVIIGIAADEASRAIDTGRPYYERPVYPLVDMGIEKADEAAILDRHGFGDTRKSGCLMCPYQPAGWFWALRETSPARWAEVLDYEAEALAENPKIGGIVGGVPVAEAVDRWRAKNPSATVDAVLEKQYGRCAGVSRAQIPLFALGPVAGRVVGAAA